MKSEDASQILRELDSEETDRILHEILRALPLRISEEFTRLHGETVLVVDDA